MFVDLFYFVHVCYMLLLICMFCWFNLRSVSTVARIVLQFPPISARSTSLGPASLALTERHIVRGSHRIQRLSHSPGEPSDLDPADPCMAGAVGGRGLRAVGESGWKVLRGEARGWPIGL